MVVFEWLCFRLGPLTRLVRPGVVRVLSSQSAPVFAAPSFVFLSFSVALLFPSHSTNECWLIVLVSRDPQA
jgi:hypothetical protein